MPKKEIEFNCPKCGGNILGELQNVMTTYNVISISEKGLDYDHCNPTTNGDAESIGYSCIDCGYELRDKEGNPVCYCDSVFEAVELLNNKK